MTTSADALRVSAPAGTADNLSQQLVQLLVRRIEQGDLKPGERFPTEIELIKQYEVSRTVVREATSSLKAEGLVETRHGVGTFVMEPVQRIRMVTDPQELQAVKEVLQLLEFRISLEAEAAAWAAQRRSESDLAGIRAALDELEQNLLKGADSTAADFQFHHRIALASGNRYFFDTLQFLGVRAIPRTRVKTHEFQALSPKRYLSTVNAEHRQIFAAIEHQLPDQARDAMRAHLTNSRERLRQVTVAGK